MLVNFSVRFISDEHFIGELLKDKKLAAKTLLKLSLIHRNSKHYSLQHNILPDECFKNAISDKEIRGHALLGAFHPEPWPSFVSNEKEMVSKMIRFAINLASRKPYVTIILTSDEKKSEYLENEHYSNGKIPSFIKILSSSEALQMIDFVCED